MQPGLQLALLIAILLPASKIAGSLCSRFSVPAILGELMVGVLLGPGAINLLHIHLFAGGEAAGALMLMAQFGGLVLMFVAGLETDVDRMREASGAAFLVALSGVVWPFLLGAGVGHLFGLSWRTACFLGGALTATSVSISARTLMDAGKMSSPEATVILGAAVIDDVMGLFVLAFLAASGSVTHSGFGLAPIASAWLQEKLPLAVAHPLIVQMLVISVCVSLFFFAGYGLANRFLDPLIRQFRKLSANEAVPSCVLGLLLVYAISAEWLGSVAGITGAYLLGYVFASSEFKADVERSFYAIGHALLIPLFFVSIGLASDYRALSGHWGLLVAVFMVAVVGKLVGCGFAALASGMNWVRSFRIGCGMISRGEVGLIVTAMGASTGIFKKPEVAVMVAIVLLTTLLTPLALRAAFQLKSDDDPESLTDEVEAFTMSATPEIPIPAPVEADDAMTEELNRPDSRISLARSPLLISFSQDHAVSE
jgi:Kef-type K+ transport system membrane component KefB